MDSVKSNLAKESNAAFIPCRPFLKWAGGKSQLLDALLQRLPERINRYFEPFFGGGALYFSLQPEKASLADVNPELVNVYLRVSHQVEDLVSRLKLHSYDHDEYYRVRALDREEGFFHSCAVERAARFIYLNKTCYNGLYRVNSRGQFNVPFGRYKNPTICDEKNLRACSRVLQGSSFTCQDFETLVLSARSGDFVYFDPPYMPLSQTSSFTRYAQNDFGLDDQERLAAVCEQLDRRGVRFMLSNSATPLIKELYKKFTVETVQASRAINSKARKRGKVAEVIVRNY